MFYEKCGCKLYKNGKTKVGIQKYICSGCKTTLSETTNTIICHSKLSFEIWKNIINNLLNGFSLRRIAEENYISLLTSFRIRHKVLYALKNIKLLEDIESDENDNLLLKIVGLVRCTTDMLKKLLGQKLSND